MFYKKFKINKIHFEISEMSNENRKQKRVGLIGLNSVM